MEFQEHFFDRQTVDMKETGWNLRKIREEKEIPVTDVAKHLNTSIQSIYNWELGKSNLNLKHIVAICGLYKISLDTAVKAMTEKASYCDYDE